MNAIWVPIHFLWLWLGIRLGRLVLIIKGQLVVLELNEYITPVPPQMRTGETWYAGTADAIYQNLNLLEESGAEFVIILSGDHIYRMDYATMLEFHADNDAAATVACMEVGLDEARGFGVMSVDDAGRVTLFEEKPSAPDPLPGSPHCALASMGIYVFNRDLLMQELVEAESDIGGTEPVIGRQHDA